MGLEREQSELECTDDSAGEREEHGVESQVSAFSLLHRHWEDLYMECRRRLGLRGAPGKQGLQGHQGEVECRWEQLAHR